MMAVPLSQHLLPPAGPKPHFRSSDHAGGDSEPTGTGSDLKSVAQISFKDDQRFKDCCLMKDKDKFDMDENSVGHNFMGSSSKSSIGRVTDGSGMDTIQSLTLWERTVVSDSGLFQLQYMDLGEFLTENGMGIQGAQIPSQSSQCPSTSPSSCSSSSLSAASATSPTTVLGLDKLGAANCLHSSPQSSLEPTSSPTYPPVNAPPSTSDSGLLMTREPDPADMELSTIPDQDTFDPRIHPFKEEELKPQPVTKKARKRLVPDNLKDEKYWSRRLKNNEAAKRSRDARRIKENQISIHAAYLERENAALRQEVASMRKELSHCRSVLKKYEGDHIEQL